jgi:hypothetical protein
MTDIVFWVFVVYLIANGLWLVNRVGQPRPPFTAQDAVLAIIFTGLMIGGLVVIHNG